MERKNKLTGWKTILYCFALVLIFLGAAFISDLVTRWIPDLSLRFIVRELVLRLPLSLFLMHLFARKVIKLNKRVFYINTLHKGLLKWFLIGMIWSSVFLVLIYVLNPTTLIYKGGQIESKWIMYYVVSTVAMAINGGLIEEILFRGYIMGLLKEKWNVKIAVLVPSALFGIIHVAMLDTFHWLDFLLLLVGGTLVGIMFSLIVIRAKNVFAASMFHFVWNLFFAGRILKISAVPLNEIKSIFAIHLESDNVLISGGNYGIEVSGIAILIYVVVSLILIRKIKWR